MVQDGHCWFVSRDTPMRRCIGRLDGAVNLTILLRGESFVVGFDYFFALFHVTGRKKYPRKILVLLFSGLTTPHVAGNFRRLGNWTIITRHMQMRS